jgi:hypothetical protein
MDEPGGRGGGAILVMRRDGLVRDVMGSRRIARHGM